MAARIRFVVSTLLAACGMVGSVPLEATAQIDLQEAVTGVPMARRQWEQRMVGQAGPQQVPAARAGTVPGATVRPAAPTQRAAVAPGASAGRVRQVAAYEEYELTPAEAARAAAENVYLEPLPNGGVHGHPMHPGAFAQGVGGCDDCQHGWGGCDVTFENYGACGTSACGVHDDCGSYTVGPLWWVGHPQFRGLLRDLSVFAGVHGFKGPLDQGRNGNFGFHEGVNFGAPLGGPWGFGYQLGLAAVHSNFTGAGDNDLAGQDRNQIFFTGGIFRRQCVGWNWGAVFDYLSDSYYTNVDLKQIRSETSWRFPTGGELGYWGAYGVGNDRVIDGQLDPTDLFAFYYRRHFQRGGDGRIWAGFSGHGDGLVGADIRVPIGHGWALENSINYLAPKSPRSDEGSQRESWGVNIQLVWYLGQPAQCALKSPFRPLFGVADNGSFMADFARNPATN